jgi:hypothetical protein
MVRMERLAAADFDGRSSQPTAYGPAAELRVVRLSDRRLLFVFEDAPVLRASK